MRPLADIDAGVANHNRYSKIVALSAGTIESPSIVGPIH